MQYVNRHSSAARLSQKQMLVEPTSRTRRSAAALADLPTIGFESFALPVMPIQINRPVRPTMSARVVRAAQSPAETIKVAIATVAGTTVSAALGTMLCAIVVQ